MWKIIVAFVIFAGLAIWMLSKGGDIDMSGEKHGVDAHAPGASEPAAPSPVLDGSSAPVMAPAVGASGASQ